MRIPLTGKYADYSLEIDEEDYPLLRKYTFYGMPANGKMYVLAYCTGHKQDYVHRILLNPQPHELIDHIDLNPLNCRRLNLRIADHQLNADNIDRTYFGCNITKTRYGTFHVRLSVNKRRLSLGTYQSEAGAIKAYKEALLKYKGVTMSG